MTEQDRRDNLIELLQSVLDYFPHPETWTGELQRRSANPGPGGFRQRKCSNCKATGKLRGGWMCNECQGLGSYWYDAYTGEPIRGDELTWGEFLRVRGTQVRVRCSSCAGAKRHGNGYRCEECNGAGDVPGLLGGRADLTGIERKGARERWGDKSLDALQDGHDKREHGSYVDLFQAMRKLRALHPAGYFLVAYVYVHQLQPVGTLLPSMTFELARAIDFLLAELPHEITLPREVKAAKYARGLALTRVNGNGCDKRAHQHRNAEIRRLYDSGGWSQVAIARKYGITQPRVAQILKGGGA